jgi:hypothetical protein
VCVRAQLLPEIVRHADALVADRYGRRVLQQLLALPRTNDDDDDNNDNEANADDDVAWPRAGIAVSALTRDVFSNASVVVRARDVLVPLCVPAAREGDDNDDGENAPPTIERQSCAVFKKVVNCSVFEIVCQNDVGFVGRANSS